MRRTECLNGFWDGVEGGLGGAIWLLVGRHCGWMSGVNDFRGFSALAPVVPSVYVSTGQWYGMVSAHKSPLAEGFPMPTSPDVRGCQILSFLFFQVVIGCSRCTMGKSMFKVVQ